MAGKLSAFGLILEERKKKLKIIRRLLELVWIWNTHALVVVLTTVK